MNRNAISPRNVHEDVNLNQANYYLTLLYRKIIMRNEDMSNTDARKTISLKC